MEWVVVVSVIGIGLALWATYRWAVSYTDSASTQQSNGPVERVQTKAEVWSGLQEWGQALTEALDCLSPSDDLMSLEPFDHRALEALHDFHDRQERMVQQLRRRVVDSSVLRAHELLIEAVESAGVNYDTLIAQFDAGSRFKSSGYTDRLWLQRYKQAEKDVPKRSKEQGKKVVAFAREFTHLTRDPAVREALQLPADVYEGMAYLATH